MTRGRWRTWGRTASCNPRRVEPDSVDAVAAVLADAAASGRTVRPVGAGHSFTPVAVTDGVHLSLDRFQGVEAVDRDAMVATVRAGTRLGRLGDELHALGLAQENLGDIDRQSLAGAIATGTHGTGLGLGALHTQVAWMELVTPAGDVVRFDGEDPRLPAARVGLGVLGVVTRVGLRVEPTYRLAYDHGPGRLDELLDDLPAFARAHRHAELYWFPHTDRVLVKRQDRTDAPPDARSLLRRANEVALENAAYRALLEVARLRPRSASTVSRVSASAVVRTRGVDESRHVFATSRLVRFVEAEHGLPLEAAAGALDELRHWLRCERYPVAMPVEVRFVAGDDAWLSMAHGRDSAFLAVHANAGMPYRRYFAEAERIFLAAGGRPHWGKLHALSAAALRPRYPRFDDLRALRAELDPSGVLLNTHLRRILDP